MVTDRPEHLPGRGPKSRAILVVGGGIAGITAALEAVETGHEVVLLERGPSLGSTAVWASAQVGEP